MQMKQEYGPLPIYPTHLPGIAEDASSAPTTSAYTPQSEPIDSTSDPIGAIRGAVYSIPVALMMWAIIIAALVYFLSL